jgi:hypothetical protein
MPTVNGTLTYFGPTKDGTKATLTGEWDDGDTKKWVTWEESQPLRDARLVFKSTTETWGDGTPKWMVDGNPRVGITKEFHGAGNPPTHEVVIGDNGAIPANVSEKPAAYRRPQRAQHRSVKDVARHFAYCLREAQLVWGEQDRTSADALYKTAFTIFQASDPDDTPSDFSDVPAALKDGPEDSADLPF